MKETIQVRTLVLPRKRAPLAFFDARSFAANAEDITTSRTPLGILLLHLLLFAHTGALELRSAENVWLPSFAAGANGAGRA